ncbi:MAG: flavin reductase [Muribaculaceae bacterium]|nr:flavin reductase [Muribaculaceae bacterium]
MKNFAPHPWVLPQPVLIIGSYNADGTPNAMNAAWGGQWDARQIMISLGSHATSDNIKRTGEFTVAFATQSTMMAADYVGLVSARKQSDKLAATGWKQTRGEHCNAPVFDCFPMTLECRVHKILDESATGFYLIADIINICVDENFLDSEGRPHVEKMKLISFDPVANTYLALGEKVGNAFAAGKALL